MAIKKYIKHLVKVVLFRKMPVFASRELNDKDKKLIEGFRHDLEAIKFDDGKVLTDSQRIWQQNMKALKTLVLNHDPRQFLQWQVVRRTMFVDTPLYILREYRYLKKLPNYKTEWLYYLEESNIGLPNRYYTLGKSSGNLIHHAYHLAKFQETTHTKVFEADFILEFGGGYGSMCRLIHKMKFNKKYVIFDLPVFSALQSYYLKSLGLPVLNTTNFFEETSGILCLSSLKDLEFVLDAIGIETIGSMFIATWSISETPLDLRHKVVNMIKGFNFFLIAYQPRFGEVDNMTFFSEFTSEHKILNWKDWKIPHMDGSRYLIGY